MELAGHGNRHLPRKTLGVRKELAGLGRHYDDPDLARWHMGPVSWGEAFNALLDLEGVKRSRGPKAEDDNSTTVVELAEEQGVHPNTARTRSKLADKLKPYPTLLEWVDGPKKFPQQAARCSPPCRGPSARLRQPLGERMGLAPYVYDTPVSADEGGLSMKRVTVEEAAHLLGIEKESVRKRIYRGSLEADKEPDGTLRVYIDDVGGVHGQSLYTDHGHKSDGVRDKSDGVRDKHHDGHRDALIAELRAEVSAWREESRRKDHIIAALVERVPALEAPASPGLRDAPETASEGLGGPEDRADGEGPQNGSERRSWWRKMFRG